MYRNGNTEAVHAATSGSAGSGRLIPMLVAAIAACIASLALFGSPAMAADASRASSDTDTDLCTPRGEDTTSELDFEAVFNQLLTCAPMEDTKSDDATSDDASVASRHGGSKCIPEPINQGGAVWTCEGDRGGFHYFCAGWAAGGWSCHFTGNGHDWFQHW